MRDEAEGRRAQSTKNPFARLRNLEFCLSKSLKGVFMDNDYRYHCIYVLGNHFGRRGENGFKAKDLESRLFL